MNIHLLVSVYKLQFHKTPIECSPNVPHVYFFPIQDRGHCSALLIMCSNSKDTLEGGFTKTNITAMQCCHLLCSSWTWGLLFSGHQLFTSYMSCKLIVHLRLHLPCSPHRSSLHSDSQMTCPGTQSTACRHEEEEEVKESWAPSPLSWCSGSPRLQKERVTRKNIRPLIISEHLVCISF